KSRVDNVFENKIKGTKPVKRTTHEWSQFSINDLPRYLARFNLPTTPAPEDVDCHMEVETTTLVGGRCVNIGRSPLRACQSGPYLDVHNGACMGTGAQATESSGPTQST
ncbi:uncharacterized protein LOC125669854, partial [Ostrea edulis]|uniref:uncharacterized protein LOC125669854 n=1 Tax=Ostrea edulis TaxID=37623 RepID=UPI0024AEBA98